LNFRKLTVVCALSLFLSFGGTAFAGSLEDTVGLPSESSINKLVALNVLTSSGTEFNPDASITRGELVAALSRVMKLQSSKKVTIKDITSKNSAYASTAGAVGLGLIKLDTKGNFNAKKGVTYAELSKALAYGLGFKLSWSDRSVDYLFYLERKGVLDIDTDLDAIVTKEAAAVALDQYITLKKLFKSDSGVIAELKEGAIVLNNGSEYKTYKLASNAALFLMGQNSDITSFGAGTSVQLLLNGKGEVSYMSGSGLSLEEGAIVYADGKVKIGETLKNIDLNSVLRPLPSNPGEEFTLANFGGYSNAGVTFGGGVYVNNTNDEVTMFELYFSKAADRSFKIFSTSISVDFSEDALSNQSFELSADVKISLKTEPDKKLTIDDLKALEVDNTLLGTFEFNSDAQITSITVTAEKKAAAK
jgi:hypothetical protein